MTAVSTKAVGGSSGDGDGGSAHVYSISFDDGDELERC